MDDNQSRTESLIDIVKGVENQDILLPEFQRDFRWDIEKSVDLFDSIIRQIFVGSIIYGKASFGLTARELDTRPRRGKNSRRKLRHFEITDAEIKRRSETQNFRLLLDGQQRITSIYRALKGHDALWIVLRDDLDVSQIKSLSLEEMFESISSIEPPDRLSICLSDAYRIEEEALDDDVEEFFEKSQFVKDQKAIWSEIQKHETFRIFRRTINRTIDLFKQQKLISFYLLDMSMEKFCIFFERSNSRGMQLDFTDILAAKLYSGFNLRYHIDQFDTRWRQDGRVGPLSKEVVVRAIAYIAAREQGSAILIDKSSILKMLDATHFNRYWERIIDHYEATLKFLCSEKLIISRNWLPTENILIPLMIFRDRVQGFERMSESQRQFLMFWFWSCIFSNRYSTSSNEVVISDCNELIRLIENGTIQQNYVRKLRPIITDTEDLYQYTRKTSSLYRGILNLVHFCARGLPDWSNGQILTPDVDPEDHHIYPRKFLVNCRQIEDNDGLQAEGLADCVVNRTLMPKKINISVGASAPSSYLQDFESLNGSLRQCLEAHLIPAEIVGEESWDTAFLLFLEARAEKILELIVQETSGRADVIASQGLLKTGQFEAHRPRRNIGELLSADILRMNDELYLSKNPNMTATLASEETVIFNGQELKISDWARKVTGWPTVNVFDRVYVRRTAKTLEDMRKDS